MYVSWMVWGNTTFSFRSILNRACISEYPNRAYIPEHSWSDSDVFF